MFTLSKLIDFNIIVSLFFLVAALLWGDWRNWKQYYPTILFFLLGNFIADYITYNHPLWEFESPLLKNTLSNVFVAFVAYPSTVLLFLPHFPDKWNKQIVYVLEWVMLYSMLEFISYRLGFFSYHNGWTIWWSILFNCALFPLLRLHHKNPLIAWIITSIMTIIILLFFDVPFKSMK